MEKYFEAVSHKNRSREDVSKHQAIKLQLQGKTKQKTKKQKPEARNHCKHLYVQIPSLSKFECLRFADFMWITNCAQVTAVSVSVNSDTPTRLDSCLLGSDLLEKPKS